MKRVAQTVFVLTLGFGVALAIRQMGEAQEAKDKTITISAQHSTLAILKVAADNNLHVYLNLKSAKEYSAKVKEVGTSAVVLKNPYGRELYEVYVPLDTIASVEVKVK